MVDASRIWLVLAVSVASYAASSVLVSPGSKQEFTRQAEITKEELDQQLDDYMSMSKRYLDAQLDAYMAMAGDLDGEDDRKWFDIDGV